jgi:hypothetical protein
VSVRVEGVAASATGQKDPAGGMHSSAVGEGGAGGSPQQGCP